MIGSTILHYEILEKLGEGGMGVVYKAEDIKLKRVVALKFLPPTLTSDPEAKERFIHEAQSASALDHNNICTIHEINETEDGQLFIAMAYYEGENLKDKITKGPINVNEAIDITVQICNGLERAHRNNIVHRDIKPANIFITSDGVVKILDFGLAKMKGQTRLTQMGSTTGTVHYMSPEQAKSEEVDQRSDIWSLGVVLYEMIKGKPPFNAAYEQAVIYNIMNDEPEPLTGKGTEELQGIISKALAKDREERYRTIDELGRELNKIISKPETTIIQEPVKGNKLPWIVAAAAVIVIAIALYLFMPTSKGGEETTTAEVKTIAVLPFDDLSPKKDQKYFSDGLSEELINVLSKNKKLRVTAKTSSFYFRGKDVDLKTIASRLNVDNILEGSVQKAGDNLRISADLVNVKTDATLWSNTYNGTMNNIFALQDSISGNVAEALNAALLGKEIANSEQKTDPEAYNDYLLGNHFYDFTGKENFNKAEEYYEEALSIDSTYAPAWVGLSNVHISQANFGYVPEDEGYSKARKEAEKALELNPNLANAYSQIGMIKTVYDWDWQGGEEAFKKALELEPENTNVLTGAALLAATLGRFNEAIKLEQRVIEIDPLYIRGYIDLGSFTWYAGLPDKSISALRKSLELNPQAMLSHTLIGLDYIMKGKPDSALAEVNKEPEPWMRKSFSIIAYYALGRKKEADNKLAEYIKGYHNIAAYQIAENYAYSGEKDKAFEWLDIAYNHRDAGLSQIVGDPLLRNIVKDPRYAVFMKKMKLPL